MINGKTITYFEDENNKFHETNIPTPSGLFNFEFQFEKTNYLVLDNYGDEFISSDFKPRLFQGNKDVYLVISCFL
jgi:hypothetical protein